MDLVVVRFLCGLIALETEGGGVAGGNLLQMYRVKYSIAETEARGIKSHLQPASALGCNRLRAYQLICVQHSSTVLTEVREDGRWVSLPS